MMEKHATHASMHQGPASVQSQFRMQREQQSSWRLDPTGPLESSRSAVGSFIAQRSAAHAPD
ncbi:hypothetical protein GGP41_004815 [Bipolaris sorokiniana]|uniref:Uncharacterized protein n=1 Tax=Cochliobolus sativus TaxID=45130 RepID=A0A8H5ZEH0_COCSA|nr:hypothetical protein GGP41_004815 [Bipolaris sorokiniana]